MKKRLFLICICILFLFIPETAYASNRIQKVGKNPVIVIDPGHGGENFGTIENGCLEKEMTMVTAEALYDTLKQFDNVEVYLTRTEDVDLSLKERVTFAKGKKADFLFSIHYNASESHELFGAEIWVPLKSPYNNYGYQFGYEFLSALQDKGLFNRGIKTRKNDKGTDYYGILREAVNVNLPAAILEHCHVDEPKDEVFCNTEDKLAQMGIDDAHAIAKYFGLKSQSLGVDYSNYSLIEIPSDKPILNTYKDETAPEECVMVLDNMDVKTGDTTITIKASDPESVILYYSYSYDGGITYSERFPWPDVDVFAGTCSGTATVDFTIPAGIQPRILVKVFNKFDLFTISNLFESPLVIENEFIVPSSEEAITDSDISSEEAPVIISVEEHTSILQYIILGVALLVSAGVLLIIAIKLMKPRNFH